MAKTKIEKLASDPALQEHGPVVAAPDTFARVAVDLLTVIVTIGISSASVEHAIEVARQRVKALGN